MPDARGGDPREYRERDIPDERPRVYDERDRDDNDARDALMRDLDLPRGEERELVVDRDRVYELNGEDSRTLAAVGSVRVVPEQELDTDHDTLGHLRDEGLVETVDLGSDECGLVLTEEGRNVFDSHTLERDDGAPQAFHAGVSRPREIDHDSKPLREVPPGGSSSPRCARGPRDPPRHPRAGPEARIPEFLRDHNRNRSESDGRPDRSEDEIRDWARQHDLPYFDGQVHFPDYRIEYEVDGREHYDDVELFTPHYRGAHAASRAKTCAATAPLFKYLAPPESADERW